MHTNQEPTDPNRQKLTHLIQTINEGRLEGLIIVDGQPAFKPAPRITHEIDFESMADSNAEMLSLFFERLKAIEVGMVQVKIKNGVPVRMSCQCLEQE